MTDSEMRQQVYAMTCPDGCGMGRFLLTEIPMIYGVFNVAGRWHPNYNGNYILCTANVALADLVIRWVREARLEAYRRCAGRAEQVPNGYALQELFTVWANELEAAAQKPSR